MELQHLQTFVAVAEAESMTRAAESLHLSQPAVSAQVKLLEDSLGVLLFQRTGRGMRLTASGEELLGQARDILVQVSALERRAAELRGDRRVVLRLGLIDCGYPLRFARVVGVARYEHPHLRVETVINSSADNARGVLDQEIDVAFVEGDWPNDARFRSVRIGKSRVGIIAPTSWYSELCSSDWSRLSAFPWVFQNNGCSHYWLLRKLCEEHHFNLEPQFRAEAVGTAADLVAEGLALSVVDLDEVQPHVDAGRVFVWNDFEYAMPVAAITLERRAREAAIAGVMAAIERVHARPLAELRDGAAVASRGVALT